MFCHHYQDVGDFQNLHIIYSMLLFTKEGYVYVRDVRSHYHTNKQAFQITA